MKSAVITGIIAMAMAASLVYAGPGTGAIDILKVPTGIKSQAMGGAYTALCDDTDALDINPAGLGLMEGHEASFIHDLYFEDVFFDSAYYEQALEGMGTVGGTLKYLSGGKITATNETSNGMYAGQGSTMGSYDYLAGVAYGTSLDKWTKSDALKGLDIGMQMKVSGESLGNAYSNTGITADIGAIYTMTLQDVDFMENRGEMVWNKVGFGVSFLNLGTSFENGITPMSANIGAYSQWKNMLVENNRVRVSLDTGYGMSYGADVKIGCEYLQTLTNFKFAIRAGENLDFVDREASGLAVGAGFSINAGQISYGLDYAFIPYGDLGNNNKIALSVQF